MFTAEHNLQSLLSSEHETQERNKQLISLFIKHIESVKVLIIQAIFHISTIFFDRPQGLVVAYNLWHFYEGI